MEWRRRLRNELTLWAANPRTTPTMLRRAIDDVVACESLVPSESYTLKAEYLNVEELLKSRSNASRSVPPSWVQFIGPYYQASPEELRGAYDAWRFWRRESERSRRVVRLAVANWLAYLDLPPDRRPKPNPNVAKYEFYSFGPEAPAQARALSPEALDRWIDTTYDAPEILRGLDSKGMRIRERADHQAMVILLGTELYRRDHGTDPPSPEALVGPYLKRLPDLFSDDERNQTPPKAGNPVE